VNEFEASLALWEYRETNLRRAGKEDPLPAYRDDFAKLIENWGGKAPKVVSKPNDTVELPIFDESQAEGLHKQLIDLAALDPHPRGFAFEKFLKDLFDANDLAARASFRLVGEQIDGSFVLYGETYLLEAKWVNSPVGDADLRSFNSKVEDKAAWSRGLFISNSGFSDDGLEAFGRGKRIVCMDGLDLSEMQQRRIPFSDLTHRKVRRCAETGKPFVRLRDLY
jgi:Restriction endonuclease